MWAANVGFISSAVNEWLISPYVSKDVTCSSETDPLLGYPWVAIPLSNWVSTNHQGRLNLIPPLRFMAKKAAPFNLRMVSSNYLLGRKQALRERNILKWARMIKPSSRVSQGFAASWFTPPEGPPRRPLTSYEAHKGAAQ